MISNKMKFLAILALLFSIHAEAQRLKKNTTPAEGTLLEYVESAGTHSEIFAEPAFIVHPMEIPMADLEAPTHLRECQVHKTPDPYFQALKDEANALREIEEANLTEGAEIAVSDAVSATTPTLVSSFDATQVGSGNPPDNTMAISNDGYVVVSVNSRVAIYNSSGSVLGQWDLYSFFGGANAGMVNDFYDPNIVYDPGNNRFIMTCCVGRTPSQSRVLVAFSNNANPATGAWYCYFLTGNPLNNNCWLDFPRIGVSTDEVFITGNLYNASNVYQSSVIYQIGKAPGYTGGNLSWQYWSNISGSPFAITPVSTGTGTNVGPGMYFISTLSGGGSSVKLHRITNSMTATNETLTYNSIACTAYTIAADASQKNTTEKLSVGDCRQISAFMVNGLIHYVFPGGISGSTTFGRLHYHRLNPSTLALTAKNINITNLSIAYPSMAWCGTTTADKSVVISFQYSNSVNFPGVGMLNVDDANNVSGWTNAAAGLNFVDLTGPGGGTSRWGDYTYMCRKRNSSPVRVWGATAFGNSTNTYTTKVFQVKVGTAADGEGEDRTDNGSTDIQAMADVEIFPNPIANGLLQINLNKKEEGQAEVRLMDLTGRVVAATQSGTASEGLTHFEIPTEALHAGAYIVTVYNNNQPVYNGKVMVVK